MALGATGYFLGAALLMGLIVNVNRFSLHGLYRNRLVRAYLGASHVKRKPDPFTGFDASDNLRMHKLRPAAGAQRLLPLINVTLNLLRNGKLAWQERKAESFSITPYFCGNFHEGYRASATYGGQGGISLGTAVTISGAAANPHMVIVHRPRWRYIKPTLRGRGEHPIPYDVYSYAKTVDAFPHESTVDQWFSESQFESYRALGFHALEQVLRSTPPQDFADLFARVASYMNPGRKRREFKPGREPSAPPRAVLDDE